MKECGGPWIFFSMYYSGRHKEMSSILADQQCPRVWTQMRGGGGPKPMSTVVHMEPK
jgi:hypothetical protein